jgi:hypothetical protein
MWDASGNKVFARWRQPHHAVRPFEQRKSEYRFGVLVDPAQRRLSNAKSRCRPAEAGLLCDCNKGAQMPQLNGHRCQSGPN